jgi:hypothetical protein
MIIWAEAGAAETDASRAARATYFFMRRTPVLGVAEHRAKPNRLATFMGGCCTPSTRSDLSGSRKGTHSGIEILM